MYIYIKKIIKKNIKNGFIGRISMSMKKKKKKIIINQ